MGNFTYHSLLCGILCIAGGGGYGSGCEREEVMDTDKSPINLNSPVKFKITPAGWQYVERANKHRRFPKRFKVDKGGFSEDQLWSVMAFFGPAIEEGEPPPLEMDIYPHVKGVE